MATFSDYVKRTVPFLGGTVDLEVRALSSKEAPAFVHRTQALQKRWVEESERRPEEGDQEYQVRLSALFAELDAQVLEVMGRTYERPKGKGTKGYYVHLPAPLVNEDDDEKTITDCRTLAERGGRMFRMAVMSEIASLADVDPFLGNSSGSPSTSTAAAGLPISVSPANSTDGCVPSSTVTATPLELVPSSPAA